MKMFLLIGIDEYDEYLVKHKMLYFIRFGYFFVSDKD